MKKKCKVIFKVVVIFSLSFANFPINIEAATTTIHITATADDGREWNGAWGANNLAVGVDGDTLYYPGWRFTGLNISGTINSAKITVYENNYNNGGIVQSNIYAWKTANAGQFLSSALPSSVPKTSASVNWQFNASSNLFASIDTPDLSPIVQELANSYGTLNSINFLAVGVDNGTDQAAYLDDYSTAGNNEAVLTITYTPGAPDATPPSVPSSLSATAISSSQINLSWAASTDNVGVTGYKIFRGGIQIGTSVTANYSDTGLAASTQYSYTVASFDAAGNTSNQSAPASATTQSPPPPDSQAPTPPAGLSAAAISSSQINLSWTASTDNVGVTGYKIYRGGTQIGTSGLAAYADTGLSPSTVYSYAVSAYDAAGNNSVLSATASATTQAQQTGTVNAASCSQSAVQTAINSAQDGYIVNVPAGTCSWSGLGINRPIQLIGAGSSSTIINGTWIIDGINGVRISGFRFNVPDGNYNQIWAQGFRIDHNIFSRNTHDWAIQVGGQQTALAEGLVDHNTFINGEVVHFGQASPAAGNLAWSNPLNMGTSHALYLEDNIFHMNFISGSYPNATDGNWGSRTILRFNKLENARVEQHSLQGGSQRAVRLWEIYNNTFTSADWQNYRPFFVRGGTGAIFHNTSDGNYSVNEINIDNARSSEGSISGQVGTFGMCAGSSFIDGNASGQQGWPCRDQIGRSTDASPWSSNFTNPAPSQASSPAYMWQNTQPSGEIPITKSCEADDAACARQNTLHILESRDYYTYRSSFNGTAGVGEGTLSNRPSTCTVGVGYWATDQGEWNSNNGSTPDGQLYTCTSTNVWTLYYKPYPYPFPLLANGLPNMNATTGNPPPTQFTLTASAGSGGSITPSGVTTVNQGSSQTFTISPNTGYSISSVTVDGTNQGSITSYTFSNITSNHTISAAFSPILTPDTTAPTIPTNLTATIASSTQINLSFNPSLDPAVSGQITSGLIGYQIYRNGSLLTTLNSSLTTYSDINLFSSTSYTYAVSSVDAAGNVSSLSNTASVTTPSGTPVPGDLNLDHIVNSLDFSLMNSKWLQSYSAYDLYPDGLINSLDFSYLSNNWGKTW